MIRSKKRSDSSDSDVSRCPLRIAVNFSNEVQRRHRIVRLGVLECGVHVGLFPLHIRHDSVPVALSLPDRNRYQPAILYDKILHMKHRDIFSEQSERLIDDRILDRKSVV